MKNGEAFLKRITGLTAATLATISNGPLSIPVHTAKKPRQGHTEFTTRKGGNALAARGRHGNQQMSQITARRGKGRDHPYRTVSMGDVGTETDLAIAR